MVDSNIEFISKQLDSSPVMKQDQLALYIDRIKLKLRSIPLKSSQIAVFLKIVNHTHIQSAVEQIYQFLVKISDSFQITSTLSFKDDDLASIE